MSDANAPQSKVLENIRKGAYKAPKTGSITKPEVPDLLRKAAADLSDDELESLIEVRKKYRDDLALFELGQQEVTQKKTDLRTRLRLDLEAEFNTGHHPKAIKAFELAVQYANGIKENTYYFYEDLADLLTDHVQDSAASDQPAGD